MAERQKGDSPQLGVRFKPEEMVRVRAIADRDFEGNASMLVKKAVRLFIEGTETKEDREQIEAIPA